MKKFSMSSIFRKFLFEQSKYNQAFIMGYYGGVGLLSGGADQALGRAASDIQSYKAYSMGGNGQQ